MTFILKKIELKQFYKKIYKSKHIADNIREFEYTPLFKNIISYKYWIHNNFVITNKILSLKYINKMKSTEFVSLLLNSEILCGENNDDDDDDEDDEDDVDDKFINNKKEKLYKILFYEIDHFLIVLHNTYCEILCDINTINYINIIFTTNTRVIVLNNTIIESIVDNISRDYILKYIINYIIIKYVHVICNNEKVKYELFLNICKKYLKILLDFVLDY